MSSVLRLRDETDFRDETNFRDEVDFRDETDFRDEVALRDDDDDEFLTGVFPREKSSKLDWRLIFSWLNAENPLPTRKNQNKRYERLLL